MPELPEVELVARYLRPYLLGRTITRVETTKPSYFFLTEPSVLKRKLQKLTIQSLERLGKYLLLGFLDEDRLLLHLGMTGQLIIAGAKNVRLVSSGFRRHLGQSTLPDFTPDTHTHLRVFFDDGGPGLYFRDTRKFGKVSFLSAGSTDPRLSRLGPDALAIQAADLVLASRSRRVKVKSWLLDQTVLAGVGNIYADEALFAAGIHPERATSSLAEGDCKRLAQVIRRILRKAIAAGGSSIDDYVHPDGSDGHFQERFNVYGREGEACKRCGAGITRIVIGQRSSHFCSSCQH